ncbi:MAG: amino acid adenylation domain-containing protein [Gordonia sp. (in: high G+C Gram-positive bacteria)]|uniref:amino acid adenylation domain-containing protein n=1 Tax=Gordonia sp. (in: high G+C Gram-positive bacteria) TaxID=84139 RepID=UPI0039E3914B
MTADPRVAAAAVAAHDDNLTAYLVPAPDETGGRFDVRDVLDGLRGRLPAYMVPVAGTVLESLPRGIHGKVDRAALAAGPAVPREHVPPRTPAERTVVGLLGELLQPGERIGVEDDFFGLGGNSLLAARLSARIGDELDIDLPVREVFDAPRVVDLARRVEAAKRLGRPRLEAAERPDVVPLSRAQQRMWLLDAMAPGTPLYNLPFAVRITGPLDRGALRRALRHLLARHEVLRTSYPDERGVPRQEIHDVDDALTLIDVDLHSSETTAEIAARGFDLAHRIPLRVGVIAEAVDVHVLVLVVHHIAADGWSSRLLIRDLLEGYAGRTDREPLPVQYADFALWQEQLLADSGRLREFWRRTLDGLPGPLALPYDRTRPPAPTYAGDTVVSVLDADLVDALADLARGRNASLFHVVHAGLAILLSRLSGASDIVVGTPVAGRGSRLLDDAIGMFTETAVLRARVDHDAAVVDLIDQTAVADLAAQANAEYPFEQIADEFETDRAGAHHPVFQTMLAFGDPAPQPIVLGPVTATPLESELPVARFDLHLTVDVPLDAASVDGPVRVRWTYATDLFDRGTVEEFAAMFQRVLGGIVRRPQHRVHDVPVLDKPDLWTVAGEWSGDRAPIDPAPRTLAAWLTESPGAAVRDHRTALTAEEFARRAARTARALIAAGIGPEDTVAVLVPRSIDMLAAIHGVLLAGGAYVPLDATWPAARLETVVAAAAPAAAIADPAGRAALPSSYRGPVFDAADPHDGRAEGPVADTERRASLTPDHPAYVLFTSGSTGVPKAVSVSHAAIVNRLGWMRSRTPIDAADTVLQKTPITFDVSVWELFWPFLAGARLVLAAPDAHRDPREIADLIAEQRVSVLHFVPAMLDAFLAADVPDEQLASLRLVFTSGEALSAASADGLLARTRAELHNLYGPTEAAVDVTGLEVRRDRPAGRPVPIGRPLPGTVVYVLDDRLRPVPAGVTGELYLGGVQVARGYHGRADLTAARFVASPWAGERGGERLYRTGDLVRWTRTADGVLPDLEYLGRSDFQIKIRGQRVELGEIETVLAACPGVRGGVAVPYDDPRAGRQLVAHVVVDPAVDVAGLRARLAAHLPEHMVPAHLVTHDALPVTRNGKVDRAALPAPRRPEAAASGRAPATPEQTLVLDLVRELLGTHVGLDDDFFAVGGNSLVATRLVAGIAERTGARVPVRAVFDARTPAALAAALTSAATTSTTGSATEVAPPARPDRIPLAPAQLPMWLHNRKDPASVEYLIVAPVRWPGAVDPAVLTAALADLLARHEILRTVYPEGADGPHQEIRPVEEVDAAALLTVVAPDSAASAEQAALAAALGRPLDLTADLPLRVTLCRDGDATVTVVAIHHIAADGWSLRVLAADLERSYWARLAGERPDWAALPQQYADHVLAHAALPLEEYRDHWRAALAGAPLEPGFRSAPEPDAPAGAGTASVHRRTLDAPATAALRAVADRTRSSSFAVLHAALAVALSRSGAGPDVVIGTPLSGRTDPRVADLIGMFVTMAPLRSVLGPDDAFTTVVERSRDTVLDALDHAAVDALEIADHQLVHVTLTVDDDVRHPAALDLDVPVARFDLEFTAVPVDDGGLELRVVHRGDVYRTETAEALLDRLVRVLAEAVAAPESPIAALDALLPAERAALAALTGPAAATPRLLHDVLETPGWRLADLAADEFAARVHRLARLLIARGAGPETVVALCLPRSAHSVIAMRAVAATGAAFVPIDPAYPAERIALMAGDSSASIVVTVREHVDRLDAVPAAANAVILDDPALVEQIRTLPAGPIDDAELTAPRHPDQCAYLIYTSGSTGRPKAVAVSHRGVASFVAEQRRYGADDASRVLHFASPSFDAAVLELLLAADAGATTVIAPTDVYGADDLAAVLRAGRVTHAFLTPAVLGTIDPGTLAPGADGGLPELTTLIVGGDVCPPETARRAIASGRRFFNAYGPTEATVMVTLAGPLTLDDVEPLPIGTVVTGVRAQVLDAQLAPCPPGVSGELYLSGPGLARGYHGRPGLTAGAFVADPFGAPGARLYRTGDLVRAVPDSSGGLTLIHLGRVDRQLKIRGFRIETGEVESALRGCDGVAAAAVTARPGPGGVPALVAYVVMVDGVALDRGKVLAQVRQTLPPQAVPAVIATLDALPLTVSGKVDERALPSADLLATEMSRAVSAEPESDSEMLVTRVFADLLGLGRIGVDEDFFALGGTSLSAAQAVARIRTAAGRELSVRDLFEHPTAHGLAAALDSSSTEAGPALGTLPRPERIPLSPAQQRMWFLNRFDPDALTENIPIVLRLRGDLDTAAFAAALHDVVARHEVLRTIYPDGPDGPHQVALPVAAAGVELDVRAAGTAPDAWAAEELPAAVRRGFDVTSQVPLRAVLWTSPEHGEHLFALVVHHICADGLSMAVLAGDLAAAYTAHRDGRDWEAPAPTVHYADYALWQRAQLATSAAGQPAWWRERLHGAPAVIDLPVDRVRPVQPSGRGARIDFRVDADLAERMREVAGAHGATPFMVAHTALAVLLGRLGENRDVVIGTPVAGRGDERLDAMVGMFVNMLALRTELAPELTGAQALAVARESALDAFAHATVPFDRVVESLDLPRTTAHHPVFQVALSFQNIGPLALSLPGVDVEVIDDDRRIAEFDLHLTLSDAADGGLVAQLDYATDLFDAVTAEEIADRYVRVLGGLVDAPETAVGDLPVLSPDDDARLRDSAAAPVARSSGLADRFHRQALWTPEATAVVAGAETFGYREFSQMVMHLAADLIAQGVGPEDRIAITAPRGPAQLLAMYATATAGAAYVPVDPSAPERAETILRAVAPRLTLAEDDVDVARLARLAAEEPLDPGDFCGLAHPENPAYVLFTSGSTGVPKGVSVPVEAVGEQLRWMQERYRLTGDDTVLIRTAAGFDLSVWEYWWPLQTGARIVLGEPGIERDGAALRRTFDEHRISVVPTVPSALAMLLDAGDLPPTVRALLCIGEELPASLVDRVASSSAGAAVHNLYGPTEASVSVTGAEVGGVRSGRVPIGTAQPSVTLRVLDRRLRPVPDGVAGELYLGGVQLARGYFADPGQSASSFVADPFDPGARMYRTGDLVRRGRDGALTYLGRTDHQIKVHGFRIEPGEVEAVLRGCPGVADAAVTSFTRGGGERLVAFVTGDDTDVDEVARAAGRRLPAYLRPEIVVVERLPYNVNGKVDRTRLTEPPAPERTHVPPRTELEHLVVRIVGEVTGAARVGVTDGFFALGGNSLSATRVATLLEAELGHPIPVRLLFETVDLGDLCAAIETLPSVGSGRSALVRGDDDGPAPMAPAQVRIWEAVRAGTGADWNVPIAMRLTGDLDREVLETALLDVVDHHPMLRARYAESAAGPLIEVRPTADLAASLRAELAPREVTEAELPGALAELAWTELDLADRPIRARLLRLAPRTHVVVVVVHHLSADGQSMGTLSLDMVSALAARCHGATPVLSEQPVRFVDYTRWRTGMLGARGARTEEFAGQLAHRLDRLGVPERDVPESGEPWDSTGAATEFRIDAEVHRALEQYAARESVGLFAVLQAAFAVVLAVRTGRDEVRVGTAHANRTHLALDGVVGNFADDIPLRLDVDDAAPFAELVRQVNEQLIGGLAHPDVSAPDLLDALGMERDPAEPAGGPFFSSTLILQQADVADLGDGELDLGPVTLRREPVANTVAKHELEVAMLETRDADTAAGLRGTLIYPVHRVTTSGAQAVVENLVGVLRAVASRQAASVGDCRGACGQDLFGGPVSRKGSLV